ncbi:DUF6563 family protein [Gelidibacter salicanalis]|uniref:DUF4468 domain-containing protein n=1 Tax=Gelidibacter salicanalis TaxID=291193 RepID=A0A934KVC7_9FLAO|nr:DUF6563 family protein [Gelidibacter salicanalis]MBJ7881523.1 hypothetical protein [Gelidibacter salicanalis]
MKNLILISAFVCYSLCMNAQTATYPEGIYMDFKEVIDKAPSKHLNVELEHRSTGKIKMNGGNDYQLNAIDKDVKRAFFLKDVYAYSEGTDLYINCFKYELQYWYAKVEGENSDYFFFKAGIPMNPKKHGFESSDLSNMFGGVFAAFGAAKRALIRLPYLLDKDTQEAVLISEKNIRDYIGSSTALVDDYEQEQEKNNVEVITTYLLKWIGKH